MESGRVKVDQKKQHNFEIQGAKVFASCNKINRLSMRLQSKFRKLFLPRYTEEISLDLSMKVLRKLSSSLQAGVIIAVLHSLKKLEKS